MMIKIKLHRKAFKKDRYFHDILAQVGIPEIKWDSFDELTIELYPADWRKE